MANQFVMAVNLRIPFGVNLTITDHILTFFR